MASTDLKKLAEEAKQILKSSEEARTKEYNKEPHLYTVNRQSIIREALVQVGKSRDSITEKELAELIDACTNYCHRLYEAFMSEKNEGIQVFAKSRINFYVIINAGINSYRKVYQVRASQKGGLRKFTNDLHRIFPESKKVNTVAFDVGHKPGSSISELTIQKALSKFLSVPKATGQGSREINKIISIAIRSYEKVNLNKAFYIEVKDESAVENQRKGREEEKQWLKDTRDALNKMISKVDWPNQRGSRSAVEAILSEILSTGRKSGAKVKGKSIAKSGPSKASTKLIIKKTTKSARPIEVPLVEDITFPPRLVAKQNWLSMVGIINAKLAPRVMANMKSPALVNRTGTFANSAKVVNIEQTREGFPSFVFDYERNPYDVFDRTKGASPWNTPERDPRALVDKSLREIVREMAIGRFYTRRA